MRIKDTIVEGYGRRKYKAEYIKYLTYAHASCDETTSQLEAIAELYPELEGSKELLEEYYDLGRKLNSYIAYVEKNWIGK